MELADFARKVPDEVWAVFEPVLPERVWVGNGRPPIPARECLHGILYIAASGIPWRMLPKCFPSYKTCQRAFKQWIAIQAFRETWKRLGEKYVKLHGVNWDQVCVDGAKHPSKKGAKRQARTPWIAPNRGLPCIWRPRAAACPSAP